MPKPPLLPTTPWAKVFESGKEYSRWLDSGESPDNRRAMEKIRQSLVLEPDAVSSLQALARPVSVVAIAEDWCGMCPYYRKWRTPHLISGYATFVGINGRRYSCAF